MFSRLTMSLAKSMRRCRLPSYPLPLDLRVELSQLLNTLHENKRDRETVKPQI